jgi:enoyl-CoA hydratase/carnithine racemase
MASERVILEVRGAIAEVRLNRPEKLNALDGAMFEAIRGALRALAANRSVRAVVLSGEGRAFCAGLDMGSFAAMAGGPREGGVAELARRADASPANAAQSVAWGWTELEVPVIAAVHGVAFGGGLQIALGADIRLVAPDARLSVMEIKWGLVPDMAGTQLLRRLARLDVVKELTYSGRIVPGAEAVALGLATRVSDDPRAAALALAGEIAEKSPHAIRAAKKLLDASGNVGTQAGLALEEALQRSLIGQPNQVEAVRANLEKRAARFADPVD